MTEEDKEGKRNSPPVRCPGIKALASLETFSILVLVLVSVLALVLVLVLSSANRGSTWWITKDGRH